MNHREKCFPTFSSVGFVAICSIMFKVSSISTFGSEVLVWAFRIIPELSSLLMPVHVSSWWQTSSKSSLKIKTAFVTNSFFYHHSFPFLHCVFVVIISQTCHWIFHLACQFSSRFEMWNLDPKMRRQIISISEFNSRDTKGWSLFCKVSISAWLTFQFNGKQLWRSYIPPLTPMHKRDLISGYLNGSTRRYLSRL